MHTPGPWKVGFSDGSGPSYITAGEQVVVRGCQDDWGITQGVVLEEDARLIAAAPELLEHLQLARQALLDVYQNEFSNDEETMMQYSWFRRITETIAKATTP